MRPKEDRADYSLMKEARGRSYPSLNYGTGCLGREGLPKSSGTAVLYPMLWFNPPAVLKAPCSRLWLTEMGRVWYVQSYAIEAVSPT